MIGGDIKVVMTLDDRDFSVKTVRAGNTLSEFKGKADAATAANKKLEGSFGGVSAKFRDLIFAVSLMRYAFSDFNDIVLALPTAFIKAGGEMERMTALMEGLSKETDALKKRAEALSNTKFIFQFAQNAPFEVKTLTDVFVKMKTAGLDPTNGSMKALTDSVAKFGGTDEQLKRAAVAIQQMGGKGVVSMEELRQQLGEAVPNAIELMARGMGLSMAELVNKISKGTVEARSAMSKMFVQMEIDAVGSSSRMMKTIPGMISQLKTQWELFKIEVAGGGAGDIFKEQLAELVGFFRSPEGKKFAQETGAALKGLIQFAVDLKDAILAMWPAIKLAGQAWLLYFGISRMKEGAAAAIAAIKSTRDAFEQSARSKRAIIDQEIKALAELRQQAEIDGKVKQQAAAREYASFKKNSDARLAAARTELQAVETLAAGQRIKAAETTQMAGKLYAQALDFEKKINDIDASGKSRQGAKRAVFVENMNSYREETIALQQKAVAMRRDADLAVENAARRVEALEKQTEADKRATFATTGAGIATGTATNQNRIYISSLNDQIKAKEALASKINTVKAGILSFGSTLLMNVGWGLAITAALTGIAYLYDKIAGSAQRAADRIRSVQDLENGRASEENIKKALERQAELEEEKKKAQTALDRAKAAFNADKSNQPYLEQAQRDFDRVQQELNAIGTLIGKSRNVIAIASANESARDRAAQIALLADDALSRTEAYKKWNEVGVLLADEKTKADEKGYAKALADSKTASLAYLAEKKAIFTALFEKEIALAKDKNVASKIGEEFRKTMKDIAEQIERVKSDPVYITPAKKPGLGAARTAAQESPLEQMYAKQQAELATAKLKLAEIGTATRDLLESSATQETFKLLGKLAAGDFDIAPSKSSPGLEPGKASGARQSAVESLKAFLAAGKGSVEDFINTLDYLNVSAKKGEMTMKEYFLGIVRNAAQTEEADKRTKALTFVYEQQAIATNELDEATRQYEAGVNFLPPALIALQSQLDKVAIKSKGATDEFERFDAAQKILLDTKFRAEITQRAIALDRDAQAARIRGIVNVRAREFAAFQLRMSEIEQERKQSLAIATDEETKLRIEKIAQAKRLEAQQGFVNSNKTELDRLYDGWTDVLGNIDKAVASSANSWMDAIFKFVETGKLSISDLVTSMLRQFAQVQLQAIFAPILRTGGQALGGIFGGIFGAGQNPGAGVTANGLPLDPTLNAVRMTMVGGLGLDAAAAAGLDPQAEAINTVKEGATSIWTEAKAKFASMYDSLKMNLGGIFDSMGGSFARLFNGLSSGFGSLFDNIGGMLGGGGGGSDLGGWASLIASFFADGGVMSSKGSMPLKMYSKGGIASGPQMAIYGEGRMNEAYVPLPDGRSIPVSMTGGGGGGSANVTVNVINQTSQPVDAKKSQPRFDGKQMILDVVLQAASQPGPFRDGMRNMVGN